MAHFAEIKESNNKVVRVLVFSNEDINANGGDLSTEAETWVQNNTPRSVNETVYWKQTSYNSTFRKNYAGKDFTYNSTNNVFITEKPFDSWDLNNDFDWVPPVQMVLPKPHPTWIRSTVWDSWNAQYTWKSPLAVPSVMNYTHESTEYQYDIRWDRNREIYIGVKHDNSFWDFNSSNETWSSSSISELPTKGVFYKTTWDEDNQKWTAVDFWDSDINYEWDASAQKWETV